MATSPSTIQTDPTCVVVRGEGSFTGKQGLSYFTGISAETTGSRGLCMHLVTFALGQRANAHLHEAYETAIYVLSGETEMWYGEGLSEHLTVRRGISLHPGRDAASTRQSGAGCHHPKGTRAWRW